MKIAAPKSAAKTQSPSTTLKLTERRTLSVADPVQKGRPAFVSSASGLVKVNGRFWVAPDDDNHLASFPGSGKGDGEFHRVKKGWLPLGTAERKAVKPDFESLAALPASKSWPNGALFAFASGSKPTRQTAVLQPVGADGLPSGKPKLIDLAPLFESLRGKVKELNIEGLAVLPDRIRLLQRGNNGTGENAIVDLDRSKVFEALEKGRPLDASMISSVLPMSLGKVNGVKLCFSDAAPLPDGRLVFSAIAEDTTSAYADGLFKGAAVGVMGLDGKISGLTSVPDHKIEGLHAETDAGGIRLFMVVDADDPLKASPLLEARLPG